MKKNWIIDESLKADTGKDYVILENPETRRYLDSLLLNRFWPVIHDCLEDTYYNYSPQDKPEISFKLRPTLERSLLFMLFDGNSAFFRGQLSCSRSSWMLESEFFLGLARDNDPRILFEILGNSRLAGNPPSLYIYKRTPDYFQITFNSGSGAGWALFDESEVDRRIKETIDVNLEMYELSQSGYISEKEFGPFMTLAYKIYEAY